MQNYILEGGLLVDPARGLVEARTLSVVDGRIAPQATRGKPVDVSGCLVLPGNACAHHHLYSALARGMPGPKDPPRNFAEILQRIWWRLDRALDLETIQLSGLLGSVEAAKAGTTSIVDHHASPEAIDGSLDALADAMARTGVRGVVCYEVTDRHGEARGRAGIAENARFLRGNRRPLIRGMMGAHASFTIGPRTLDGLVAEARSAGAPIHIHLAEDRSDENDSLEKYRVRTARRLAQAGALAAGDLVAHGVHLDDGEQHLVTGSGAWVAHNPRSNMNNGVGYAPVLRLGEQVALGTDGIDGDMFAETRTCYLKAREASWDTGPGFATSRLTAGARMVGSIFDEPQLGTLAEGAPADLIVFEYGVPTPVSPANVPGHFVFGLTAAGVRDVMVGGTWVVRHRRHQLVDEEELTARCREAAPKLWARMEAY